MNVSEFRNGFIYVVKTIDDFLNENKNNKHNENYIICIKMIPKHSIALLYEIKAVKLNVKVLASFKKLAEIAEKSDERTEWGYSEWESLYDQLTCYSPNQ